VSKSANGQTICLASGNYGAFSGGVKSSMTTIAPEVGATVTMALHFAPAANVTVDGIKAGIDPVTGLGALLADSRSHDITIRNSVFDRAQVVMRTDSLPANANILLDHNVHSNYVKCSNCYEGRVAIEGATSGPDGITVQNSEFYGGNSDGIQVGGRGDRILNNHFHDIVQQGTAVHADSIQLVGPSNATIRGNYFHDVSDAIMAPDGGDHETIEDNVVKDSLHVYAITLGGDNGSVIAHNTVWGSGQTCDFGECGVIILGAKSGTPRGTVVKNNIATDISDGGVPTQNLTEDYNLIAHGGTGAHDIQGVPTYLGETSPSTLAGFALTSSSLGHAGADDDGDIGATIP